MNQYELTDSVADCLRLPPDFIRDRPSARVLASITTVANETASSKVLSLPRVISCLQDNLHQMRHSIPENEVADCGVPQLRCDLFTRAGYGPCFDPFSPIRVYVVARFLASRTIKRIAEEISTQLRIAEW